VSVIQILDDADVAFRISGAELRTVLSATTIARRQAAPPQRTRFCVLTILPPVTALTVGLPAQRAIAQRFRALARFGPAAASPACPLSGDERTWLGCGPGLSLTQLGSRPPVRGGKKASNDPSNWTATRAWRGSRWRGGGTP